MSTHDDSSVRRDVRYTLGDGQAATVTFAQAGSSDAPKVFHGHLLNLSHSGAKLSVPTSLPISETLRLKFNIEKFALEFYVRAQICWSEPDGEGGYQVGCSLTPGIPPGLFERLATDGRLDRRNSPRYEDTLSLRALRGSGGKRDVVTLKNYSRGGFCMLADRPGEPGEPIQICVNDPDHLLVIGKTQWQVRVGDSYLLGCSFQDDTDYERLQRLCGALEAAGQAT